MYTNFTEKTLASTQKAMNLFVSKAGMKIRIHAITFIFLCTLESFLFRFPLVLLEKSELNFKQSIKLGTEESEGNMIRKSE